MQNWDDFRFILALSKAGSMSLAAKYLKTDATTVSRRVARLSSEYGLNLFRKTKGSWVLTNAGEEFVQAARSFNGALENLRRVKENQLSGQSVILNTNHYIVTEFLAPKLKSFDAVKYGLRLAITSSDKRISLAYGEADIALRLSRPNEGRLIGSRIGKIGLGIYALEGADLSHWIGLTNDLDWTPEMQMGLEFFQKPPDLRLPGFDAIRTAAKELAWPAIIPHDMVKNSPEMKRIDPNIEILRDVWAVIHETRRDDHALRVVRNWAIECLH